ncbi:gene transfer agent (GTA) orfg8 [Parvibaculum lavamentivorans DS-1]|uniref:Gene transfer agent (GTA) orfg8 n=1 Tax=Parvibaculum lavamentivorans (strain DS-1 / DSM 13023 / NCIMB 13966) TaxID=402881 RepID=A7HRK0_PARL1|nr:DUF3168 domain-containing protein [Parvibaculum lavamentivorans]ABS62533.1 gene transfer agent (GTA) orfg8 [Parvibaculum lavamentivorans DS-1]
MNADLALQKAIYARLMGDEALTALAGGRIHDNVPGDTALPYIALGDNDMRDWPGGAEHRLALHVFSRGGGRAEAKAIMGAANAALHDAALTLEGHALINLRFLDATTRRERDGVTWRGTIRFRAVTEEIFDTP